MSHCPSPADRITACRARPHDALDDYLDTANSASLSGLGRAGRGRDFEQVRNRMALADHAHVAALDDTHAATLLARSSTATLLA